MIGAVKSWRDQVKIHPAADMFPMMSDDELAELGKDINENSLRVPITFWTPTRLEDLPGCGNNLPEKVFLLDGRNRVEAIERAITDPEKRAEAITDALNCCRGGSAKLLCGDTDPWAYVISSNLHRRHLSRAQKRDLIVKLLSANPARSDRATAELAKVSDKTVGAVRAGMEARAEIPNVSTRTDAAGRQQPATKHSKVLSKETQIRPPREQVSRPAEEPPQRPISPTGRAHDTASKAGPKPPPSQERSQAISAFSKLLHSRLHETLDDLTRILRDESLRIAEIPMAKRETIALGYVRALGVDLTRLRSMNEGVDHDRPRP